MTQRPRLIIADNNIRNTGGHHYELASLLLDGADQIGYRGILATHKSFQEDLSPNPVFDVIPTFRARRMINWSLGVDGQSRFQRNLIGKSIGGSRLANTWINFRDRFRPQRSPLRMLKRWAEDLARLLSHLHPTSSDSLVINTGNDFTLLAVAAAMQRCVLPPLRIDVIFHSALYDRSQANRHDRLRQIGPQIETALQRLAPHRVYLHATTRSLAQQLRETGCQHPINAIPYPTRIRQNNGRPSGKLLKAVLAGQPREEKRKDAVADLLYEIEQPLLRMRRLRLSMQMPGEGWQPMIPPSLERDFLRASVGLSTEPLEIMPDTLSTDRYHRWLDSADLGLFLHDPDRYAVRCSGNLLEMLVRGTPVIVPDNCWLADQVSLAGGTGSIGYIYQDRSEIPKLIERCADEYEFIRQRSSTYATTIATQHESRNTLRAMGFPVIRHDVRNVA